VDNSDALEDRLLPHFFETVLLEALALFPWYGRHDTIHKTILQRKVLWISFPPYRYATMSLPNRPIPRGEPSMQESMDAMWNTLLRRSREEFPEGTVDVWLSTCLPLSLENGTFSVDVPNVFVKEQIQSRFLPVLENAAREQGIAEHIVLHVTAEVRGDEQKRAERAAQPSQKIKAGMNPQYVFDTFVVGKSNRLAHASSLAVAESPGGAYNPLFIWGGSGLGKTHLMHAIAHHVTEKITTSRVVYVSAEKFMNELISAIQNNRTQDFKTKYRNVDLLLIDDIQFLANRESTQTQEEFFHTFNELHKVGKQIVLTSDRPPKDIKTLEERIRTRFEWGLIADISTPDFETRIAIIKRKAELLQLTIPDEVAEFIANRLKTNIRQLEGAVKKLKALKHLAGSPPSMAMAQSVIRDILNDNQPVPVTVERIIGEVAGIYGVTADDIRSNKRSSQISTARKVAIYVVREITEMPLSAIGTEFGGRDHSTIVYAIANVEESLKKDAHLKEIVEDLVKNIREK